MSASTEVHDMLVLCAANSELAWKSYVHGVRFLRLYINNNAALLGEKHYQTSSNLLFFDIMNNTATYVMVHGIFTKRL
jgi:hypothetical protein